MNQLLEKAVEAVRQMPPDDQEKIARLMLSLAEGDQSPEQTDPAHLPDILESLAQLRRGEFASDADIETAFRRFGS
jgi:hypothetical protein